MLHVFIILKRYMSNRHLLSFPTRRSSDLQGDVMQDKGSAAPLLDIRGLKTHFATDDGMVQAVDGVDLVIDRKSTRLNSSHRCISYAVFFLKKKKNLKI